MSNVEQFSNRIDQLFEGQSPELRSLKLGQVTLHVHRMSTARDFHGEVIAFRQNPTNPQQHFIPLRALHFGISKDSTNPVPLFLRSMWTIGDELSDDFGVGIKNHPAGQSGSDAARWREASPQNTAAVLESEDLVQGFIENSITAGVWPSIDDATRKNLFNQAKSAGARLQIGHAIDSINEASNLGFVIQPAIRAVLEP